MTTRGRGGHRGSHRGQHGGGRFGLPPIEWFQPQADEVSSGMTPPRNRNEGQQQPAIDIAGGRHGGRGGNMFAALANEGQQQPAIAIARGRRGGPGGNLFTLLANGEQQQPGMNDGGNMFSALANGGGQQPCISNGGNMAAPVANEEQQQPAISIAAGRRGGRGVNLLALLANGGQQQPGTNDGGNTSAALANGGQKQTGMNTAGIHHVNKPGDLGKSSWATPFDATPNPALSPSRQRQATLQADIADSLPSITMDVPTPGPLNQYLETAQMKLFYAEPAPSQRSKNSGPVDAVSEDGSWHTSDEEGGDTLSLPSVKRIARPEPLPPQPSQPPPKTVPSRINYTILKNIIFHSCDPNKAGFIAQGILRYGGVHVCNVCHKARDQAYQEANQLRRMTIVMGSTCEKCQEKAGADTYRASHAEWVEQQQKTLAQAAPGGPVWGNAGWDSDCDMESEDWSHESSDPDNGDN